MILHLCIIGIMLLLWGIISIWYEIRLYRHNKRLNCFHALKASGHSSWKRQVYPGRR
jgi:hypothetical protein